MSAALSLAPLIAAASLHYTNLVYSNLQLQTLIFAWPNSVLGLFDANYFSSQNGTEHNSTIAVMRQ